MGPGPAVFFSVTGFFVMNLVCIPSIHAGSRTIWAFSRDQMIPGHRIWYKIHKSTDTPLYAVWLYASLCILVNLIGLGSPILIAAIFNVCAIALNLSYCIPITCKLFYRRFTPGPWHLGRFSFAVNTFAVLWNLFLCVIFVLPTIRPVTAENMNYASVVLVFVLLFSLVYWFLGGRKTYNGPRTHAHIANGEVVSIEEVLPDEEKASAVATPGSPSVETVDKT